MATDTTLTLTAEMQTYYDKKLLSRFLPQFVYAQWGQKRPIPKNGGKVINFRKFNALSAATTALTEGVTPAGSSGSVTADTATVAQYGDFLTVSDVLDLTAIDPVLDEYADVLGDQAADTIDQLVRDILCAGTNVQYANNRASRATVAAGDNLTVTEIRKAVRTLKRNKVRTINGYYIAVVEPGATYDLQSDTLWQDANKYAGATQLFSGEIGRIFGVRFVETANAKKFAAAGAAGIDVYATIVFGEEAYGMVDVSGSGAVKNIIKPFGSAGTADPLDQRATTGWKCLFTAKILQQAAILRIEHAVSG
ncbi:N4-gp56 family major capsid protein [Gorillibacterium sp. sgz5001074]|uniref:N4-gp56 family major capsid protein n=1 Tax=Gorillibacterium sp. sgz5001074 TaxID=3446695 RepID=UPI003F673331